MTLTASDWAPRKTRLQLSLRARRSKRMARFQRKSHSVQVTALNARADSENSAPKNSTRDSRPVKVAIKVV